jgi:hypothetical protein
VPLLRFEELAEREREIADGKARRARNLLLGLIIALVLASLLWVAFGGSSS